MTKRGEPLPINQAMNRPRAKLGLDLSAWMAIVFVNVTVCRKAHVSISTPASCRASIFRAKRNMRIPSPKYSYPTG